VWIKYFVNFSVLHHLQKQQYRKNKNIITISNESKKAIIDHYGIDSNKIKVIPNCVNTKKFNPSNESKEIREKYGKKILLYSGLMVLRKQIPILLNAMPQVIKENPDVHLILTGKGRYLNDWKLLSNYLGIQNNTSFLGFVEENELLKLYASSDIFVFPSETEGFGQVLLEAMASGTPVICANKPPMSEIIEEGGITFKLNDPNDLSKKIINLFNNQKQLMILKENALKVVKKYDCRNVAKLYQEYFKKIILKRSKIK
jgi:glycosyltransferase involved in cell wall biosynthesis